MTPGKPGSPVAKAMARVTGAVKGPEPEDLGAPASSAAHAQGAGGVQAPTRPGARPNGSAPPAPASAPGTYPTAPVGNVPPYGAPTAAAAGAPVAGSLGTGAPAGAGGAAAKPAPAASTGRRVRLTVARVDPWSVMKISFLVSVAIGIAFVVMVAILWLILDGMGVYSSLNRTIGDINGTTGTFNLMDYIALPRVMSLSV
ncbi:MAG: DUF3566 domain-containing protein, partial [Actinomycetota bacterium]|nr:DUF3566 domain-containing protein [Actinomycetota bacterium]